MGGRSVLLAVPGSGFSLSPPLLEVFFGYGGLAHDTGPDHPESSARLSVLLPVFTSWVEGGRARFLDSPADPDLSLYRAAHESSHIDFLEQLSPSEPPVNLDGDTRVGHATVGALKEIAGVVRNVSKTPPNSPRKVFCAVRPPGHHAHYFGGMGFCAVNHLALLCVERARISPEERILVLDFDVHHGNGTIDIIRRLLPSERTLFISTHRYPFYPGTGSGRDNVEGERGEGILDIPLPSGTDDEDYRIVLEEMILPRWDRFGPDSVLVSAGFDGHVADPLGDMALTELTYRRIGEALRGRENGLTAGFLEGGYSLPALSASVDAFLSGWNRG